METSPNSPIVRLPRMSGAAWQRLRAFPGEAKVETRNSVYRFDDGVFSGRMRRPLPSGRCEWEVPASMKGLELIGFLCDEGGLWSFSPRWRSGSIAVMTSEDTFTLTSPTTAFAIGRERRPLSRSGVYAIAP